MRQQTQDAMQTAQQSADNTIAAINESSDNNNTGPVFVHRPVPVTPRPTITPGKGNVKAGTLAAIFDSDPQAIVFYTTDGSKPSPSSLRYTGPITVTAKMKISAMAFDVNEQPSGVVKKTFRVKS